MRTLLLLLALVMLAAACSGDTDEGTALDQPTTTTSAAPVESDGTIEPSYAGTIPAPEFPDGLDWLNTERPLRLEELKGKIVLLDFWTYGCINCIHVIPDLKRLEEEYPNELVVIGVHSAKFTNEAETDNIRQIVLRYGIEHPVVNDHEFAVWSNWGAQAWPTTAVIDPAGNVVGMHAGEGVYSTVQPVIASLVNEFSSAGLLDATPLDLALESANQPNTVLSYPGKVATDNAGSRLFISDTGHNRVVTADATTGEILAVYGSGEQGFVNGQGLGAAFNAPQGLAFDSASETLFVADTNNHAIRAIDLTTGTVETVAGTGQLGWPPAAGLLEDVRLNSPWGLALNSDQLWIAMAGFHQIWTIDLAGGIATPAVGSGLEGVDNGPLTVATLAQPSGVAFDDEGRLYFADSESSSIRWADVLADGGSTGVLAGSDVNLFDFGDVDGTGTTALLQHPLGIVWDPIAERLLVADTYNSKLKTIDPVNGHTTTYLGSTQGWADGTDPLFYEPGGLALNGRILFVADTNNHVVRRVELDSGNTSTLVLHGIENFAAPDAGEYAGHLVTLEPVAVASGPGELVIDIELPDGYKVNDDAPSSVTFATTGTAAAVPAEQSLTGATLPAVVPVEFLDGAGGLVADVTLLYCRNDSQGLCIIEQIRFEQALTVTADGANSVTLPHIVVLPEFAE